jgi:hypothetical protein
MLLKHYFILYINVHIIKFKIRDKIYKQVTT